MSTEPDLQETARRSWGRFLDVYEPLRADLYRYCRHLTRSPWDAEDMTQDTLLRAYATLGVLAEPPPEPRAWLFRVASNLWIDRLRREVRQPKPATSAIEHPPATRDTREAAGTLLTQLSPQERAAVVLKDVFDFSLDEIAETLSTTAGAVKSALHRGRHKLVEPRTEAPEPVAPRVLSEFCAAFDAGDLSRLTGLLLDSASLEFPGVRIESGVEMLRRSALHNTIFGCEEAGYRPESPPRSEVRNYRGEPLLLWWIGDAVDAVVRVEIMDDRISRLCNYRHSPEATREVCDELGVPFRIHGYRPHSRISA